MMKRTERQPGALMVTGGQEERGETFYIYIRDCSLQVICALAVSGDRPALCQRETGVTSYPED